MFKVAVCDDEAAITDIIETYIHAYTPLASSVEKYTSGEVLAAEKKNFDLIFLDIDMAGIDGIETARRIRDYDKRVKIVYVTSYRDDIVNIGLHFFLKNVRPYAASCSEA